MTANNDPLGVEFCLSVSRGRTRREGLLGSASTPNWLSPSGRLIIVATISRKCPEVIVRAVDKIAVQEGHRTRGAATGVGNLDTVIRGAVQEKSHV
jgi:hypothetical protein